MTAAEVIENLRSKLAIADGRTAAMLRVADREIEGRKAAQKRVRELEDIIRDARIEARKHEETPVELAAILWRPSALRSVRPRKDKVA